MARGPSADNAFSKSKSMELPRSVVVGHDVIERTAEVCLGLPLGRKALIVADATTSKVAGERIRDLLDRDKFDPSIYIIEKANESTVREVEAAVKAKDVSFLLGVGGGQPIDVAKCAAHQSGRPFISVPTAASHDGVVSATGSIASDGRKVTVPARGPLAVIMDTAIIAEAPYSLLAAGCADVISNLSAVRDWDLARRIRGEEYSSSAAMMSEAAATLLLENVERIRPGEEESAWLVCKALASSGVAMAIAGSSRPASGSEHLFSHAYERIARKPALHGEQCGVGTIMMLYLHGYDWKRVRDALSVVGAPTTARDLGANPEDIIHALTMAHTIKPDRYTILGDGGLAEDAAENLARETGVLA